MSAAKSLGLPVASVLEPVAFEKLEGWTTFDSNAALDSFRRSCLEIVEHGSGFSRPVRFGGSRTSWLKTCGEVHTARDARQFFERCFRPYRVRDADCPDGLFTGYFEPQVQGSRTFSAKFNVPIYRPPSDLVCFSEEFRVRCGLAYGKMSGQNAVPYFTRREIEEGALSGQDLEVVYLSNWADAFFIHVQGSGRVKLQDGSIIRLTFAAKSGRPYTSIGSLLVERGAILPAMVSMQLIRSWMHENPHEARALMWENQSFIFFREVQLERDDLGALGAQHVQLTPAHSLAVDRSAWMLGTPVWLDTMIPAGEEGNMTPFRQLLIAQDTGSAIRGLARGDVYWGFGEEAARIAGPLKSPGSMTVLLPIPVADELGIGR
jgi:membrane-bound lytic murein transglycosylase A